MGAGYASGKFAIALCDQCGFQFKLLDLIKDWQGFKVCDECYEPKHPQLETKRTVTDPQALFEPRPEAIADLSVFVGSPADSAFASVGMQPAPIAPAIILGVTIGTVTVEIT